MGGVEFLMLVHTDLASACDLAGAVCEALARPYPVPDRADAAISCSIGLAANKLVAKIASDLDKPDGLTLLGFDDIPARIWPLAAKKINGIGPTRQARLRTLVTV